MKIYLLPEQGNFYKANLHCHSTLSDGKWTPEEIKENYKAHGYSIVAYTDHRVFIPHNELADESFLPLNGYEIDISGEEKTCHFCFVSLDKDRKVQNIFYECSILERHKDEVTLAEGAEPIQREYTAEFISKLMTEGRNDGFFVTYNHPVWSLETRDEYCNYHGMHAMEMVNYGCVVEGYSDRNENIYDEMLRGGERIYCVSTDDNHDRYPISHPKNDSFGGFTVIKADKLEYGAVAKALINGDFYASEGPEIKELYYEDGKIHIKTSDATRIAMITERRYYRAVTADTVGETVNEASFAVEKKHGRYVRFSVYDKEGRMANTNAYFLDTLPIEDEN